MYWLAKRMLPIPALVAAHPALALTFRFWNEQREDGRLPPRCALDTPHFRLLVPDAHWIDMRRARVEGLVDLGPLRAYADAVAAGLNRPEPVQLGAALVDDLENAVFVGTPIYLQIDQSLQA